jgi:hypothetical protein
MVQAVLGLILQAMMLIIFIWEEVTVLTIEVDFLLPYLPTSEWQENQK